jgi:hypothetical protein
VSAPKQIYTQKQFYQNNFIKKEIPMKEPPMKKKILISSASVLLFCFISLLISPTHNVNAADGEDKYVAAKSGINLRSGAGKSSSVITTIPFGSKVTIEKSEGDEIFLDGRYGKWVNVKYGNKTGWVFSGFLCDFKPDTIIKVAANYYGSQQKREERRRMYLDKIDIIGISIGSILDNHIVLNISAISSDGFGAEKASCQPVWKYDIKQKKFFEAYASAFYASEENYTILFYLDDDRWPDILDIHEGFFLGSENGFIEVLKLGQLHCADEYSYYISGFCENIRAACGEFNKNEQWSLDIKVHFFKFNCKSRKFERYAESDLTNSKGTIISIDWKKMSIVIKDEKDKKDTSYKFSDEYTDTTSVESEKDKLQKDKDVSFSYVTISGKKIIRRISVLR